MRVLLDTNIVIHREASRILNKDIGLLFNWLDKLNYEKWVHQLSIKEIEKFHDQEVIDTMKVKIGNYNLHTIDSEENEDIIELRKYDKNENDYIDTSIVNEVYQDRYDYLITEDRGIHKKAEKLGIEERVFSIDSFLDKVTAENPSLVDYKVLAVKKEKFGMINLSDPFFDSFKSDYAEFERWFKRKSENESYVCITDDNVRAFLYLKQESNNENYSNINPPFPPKKRLKIGTFKVESTGLKLGERFLKIVFDNALNYKVDEIYVTLFDKREEQNRLIYLLKDWGFKYWGIKKTSNGSEHVYIRDFSKKINKKNPKETYPLISVDVNKFIVPIYPQYHTDLLPDSILNNESPENYIESEPYRNAIQKVYVSRSFNRNLNTGDIILFYRTGGYHRSVISTLAIVESVKDNIINESQFIELCRKRSVLNNEKLKEFWNYKKYNRPFIVNFLHVYSFPKRINMKRLIELGVIADVNSAPRGFEPISDDQFKSIIEESQTNESFIID